MELAKATSTSNADLDETSTGCAGLQRQPRVGQACFSWADRTIDGWKWKIREDWLSDFNDGSRPDWLDLDNDSRATLIKANDSRQVWRVQLGARLVFAKISQPARQWARLRRVLLGSNSSRERGVADYAAAHLIDTVIPIASADSPISDRRQISILITEGVANARPLNAFWAELDPTKKDTRLIKNRVIDVVARLIAHAHQNGFEHSDLHAGNVLIEALGDATYRALFVDLNNVRIGRAVSGASVTRNLAQFNQWFRIRGLLTDRIRFLNRYLYWRNVVQSASSHGRRLNCNRRELLGLLASAVKAHADTLYAQRDRRAMRKGRYFTKLKLPSGWCAHVFLESKHVIPGSRASECVFTPDEWKRRLQHPLDWVNMKDQRHLLKDSTRAAICRAQLPLNAGGLLEVVCKRTISSNILRHIQNIFRTSRPMITWKRANALLHRQIPTARPLAIVERRRLGLLRDSLIIVEYITDAHDLDTILTVQMREMSGNSQRQLKRQIIEALVSVLRRLNDCGFYHRDFKAPNIIVQWDRQSDNDPRVILIDLDGIREVRFFEHRARMRMLMRLNVSLDHCRRVSRTDRLRFLKRYLDRPGRPAFNWKPIWRRIADLSTYKRAQSTRRQEQLIKKYGRC